MKKTLLIVVMTLIGLAGYAQSEPGMPKFGYLSYEAVMQAMPQYAQIEADLTQLRIQYEAEQKRVEDDFNTKYEEFLDGQKNFPKTILQKRQSELQEMMDRNIAFKKESQRLLADAENHQKSTLRNLIQAAVEQIGQERGYAFVLDTDIQATTWINPAMGEDISEAVKKLLK